MELIIRSHCIYHNQKKNRTCANFSFQKFESFKKKIVVHENSFFFFNKRDDTYRIKQVGRERCDFLWCCHDYLQSFDLLADRFNCNEERLSSERQRDETYPVRVVYSYYRIVLCGLWFIVDQLGVFIGLLISRKDKCSIDNFRTCTTNQ